MSWIELSLDTTNEAVDWVCTLLANAIAAEDMHIGEYRDRDPKWTYTIQIYLAENAQIHQRIEAIAKILTPLHRTGMTSELQTFIIDQKPEISAGSNLNNSLIRRIGDRFVILSSESRDLPKYQTQNPQEILLYLQNSLAFGSGLHPATILSLRFLERHIQPNMHTLDLGSGSGILSVAMAKLGAKVLAIDNDRLAVEATQDAVERNQVTNQVTVTCGSLGSASELGHWMGGDTVADDVPAISANGEFDLIVANIFARVHISLAHDFYQALRRDTSAILITAGYTSDREEDLISAMGEAGLVVGDREQIDEWLAIAFRK
ncbi:50S ribosomal protein L11 methyltransferase [Pseudanabaena sp. FACHB-1998]|uniref:50S ribosomal protein L11 methyltransferase n=1 Tax=Pseudanabaena sp. FACHB-1998 TaxID=2692858 RepID=UPI00168065B3|nr:50S ribosomal protein L11 methyltransferase [Pseudanabaena sp. FACHB-1998]MBD2176570.1 50S ribosomal protein L11 methyltransferase [Pseudanabaena sp. FACHB-1998]